MNLSLLSRAVLVAAALCVIGGVTSIAQAGCGIGCKTSQCCPKCDHVCKLTAEEVDVEKSCFEVEYDYICIPRVVFPWQRPSKTLCSKKSCGSCTSCDGSGCKSCSACPNNGATIRKIKKLKTKKYKCPECEYTWEAEKKGCGSCSGGCGASCSGGCGSSGSCDAGCACGNAGFSEATEPPAMDLQPVPMPYSSEPVMMEPNLMEPVQTEVHGAVAAPVYQEQFSGAADYYARPTPQN